MDMAKKDVIVVFTARSPERIILEAGSQAWVLNQVRARQCEWLVCTQNQHNPDHNFSDATQPHGSGFLVGKISAIVPSPERSDRWIISIDQYARIGLPDLWPHGRNPVWYASLQQLGIDPSKLDFRPLDRKDQNKNNVEPTRGTLSTSSSTFHPLTIADAKKALAQTYGVQPEAIEITIRG